MDENIIKGGDKIIDPNYFQSEEELKKCLRELSRMKKKEDISIIGIYGQINIHYNIMGKIIVK